MVHLPGAVIKLALVIVVLLVVGLGWMIGFGGAPVPHAPGAQVTTAADDQTVEITQDELTNQLNQQLAGRPLGATPVGQATMRKVAVQLTDGQLQVSGDAEVGGTSVPVTMTGTTDAENGRALVTVTEVKAAGVPLPASARDAVQQAIQSQVDADVARMHLRVKSVTVSPGKLVVKGTPG